MARLIRTCLHSFIVTEINPITQASNSALNLPFIREQYTVVRSRVAARHRLSGKNTTVVTVQECAVLSRSNMVQRLPGSLYPLCSRNFERLREKYQRYRRIFTTYELSHASAYRSCLMPSFKCLPSDRSPSRYNEASVLRIVEIAHIKFI